MTVTSMTGFAAWTAWKPDTGGSGKSKASIPRGWICAPATAGFDHIEAVARKTRREIFARGNLSINLVLQRPKKVPALEINRDVLEKMMALAAEFRGSREAVYVESLMGLRGVIEVVEEATEAEELVTARDAAVAISLEDLLSELAAARLGEGERFAAVVEEHISEIEGPTSQVAALAKLQPERCKARLTEKLDELLDGDSPVSDERLPRNWR